MTEPFTLVPGRPDAEVAEELKRRIEAVYAPVCKLFDEATAAGFIIQVSTGPNAFGKFAIASLMVAKKF